MMKGKFTKDENELRYANVQETVQDTASKTEMSLIKMIMARPAFKWTAVAILVTLVIIAVVVPTTLEVTTKGTLYNPVIQRNVRPHFVILTHLVTR